MDNTSMDAIFNGAPLEAGEVATGAPEKKKDAKVDDAMREEFMKSISEDAEFQKKLSVRSGDIKVVNSLSYGTKGGLIPDKSKPKEIGKDGKPHYRPITVPEIVGYVVQNISNEPIPYITCECTADENGIYQVKEVQKTMAPGESVNLPRKYFTMLTYRPEFSFKLANGKVISSKKQQASVEDMLTKPYFQFDGEDKGRGVHDDDIKISISREEKEGSVILDQYLVTFGFLNNPVEKSARKSRSGAKTQVSAQEMAANFIRRMVEGSLQSK